MPTKNFFSFCRFSCTILSVLAVSTCSFADDAFTDLSSPFPAHGSKAFAWASSSNWMEVTMVQA